LIINLVEEYNGMTQDEAANLMWRAYARTGLAILHAATDVNESDDWMRGTGMVFERMNEIFTKVATGDGFYEDHSFIQHNYVGYTGSYGVHLFLTASKIIYICDASSATNSIGYRINSTHVPSIGTFKTSIGKSYQHLIFKGGVMDMVRGRAISRPDQESREVGLNAISGLVRLAYSVNTDYFTASEKAVYKQIVKEWVVPNLNTAYDYYSTDDIFGYVKSKVIVDDVNIAQTSLNSAVAYGAMDKAVQVNGNRAFGVSMVSRDSYHYEAIAQENKRGWYTNFGATYLYNQNDLLTFDNNYWATVEHNRLAGVTVVDGAAPLDYEGGHSVPADIDTTSRPSAGYWAGGVAIGGNHDGSTPDLYSVAAMYMKDFYSPLTAKKSWYMFDDEIVSLGSGISSSDSRNHITMIENRLLTDDLNTVFTVDDVQQLTLATSSTEQSYNKDDPQWAHLTKVGGFYFPDSGTKLRTKRVQNSGSWSLMKNGASSTPITNNFLSMWLRHGGNPSNAKYAYFILPLKTAYQTETYANSSTKAKVLRNDADVSSVREPNLKVTGITFWESNKSFTNADDGYTVTSSDKATVMIKKDAAANVFEVVVSNPSRSTANSLTLTFSNQTVDAKLTSTSFISFQKSGSNLTSITCDLDAARTNGNPEMQFKIKFELN
jgi:hyaluronate lyase